MVVLVVGTPCMIHKSLPLMSPYIGDYEAKDTMIMVLTTTPSGFPDASSG
mgnify:FL=1